MSDFSTDALLQRVAAYPVSKVATKGAEWQKASALAEKANSMRFRYDTPLTTAINTHREIAKDHRKLAAMLSREGAKLAASAHRKAAKAHDTAADEIESIMSISGGSVASNDLTGSKAKTYAVAAARFSHDALQATEAAGEKPVTKVHPYDIYGKEAEELAKKHTAATVDWRGIGGAHIGLGVRHHDFADSLQRLAEVERAKANGSDTPKSRAYDHASVMHRAAMEAHYTAGRTNEDNAYNTSKVEGAEANRHPHPGNAKWASDAAARASKSADEAVKAAEKVKS